jgi:AhpD family alkylhydroperoxidase
VFDARSFLLSGIFPELATHGMPGRSYHLDPSTTNQENIVDQRIDFYTASKDALQAMMSLEKAVSKLGLDPKLLDLVKLRASQINGCAFCVDLHSADLRKAGESERRVHTVTVWRETPFFTPRERAALAWTEAITRVSETHAPDEDYEMLRSHFTEKEMVDLTLAIIAINGWNRLSIGFRKMPSE